MRWAGASRSRIWQKLMKQAGRIQNVTDRQLADEKFDKRTADRRQKEEGVIQADSWQKDRTWHEVSRQKTEKTVRYLAQMTEGERQTTGKQQYVIGTLQQKSHLFIPCLGIARPQPQFQHSCVYERFIYSQDRSTYFLQQNRQTDGGNI